MEGRARPIFFPLPRRWIAIGRAIESDIVIPDDYCSRHHCAIYWDERSGQHVLILIKAKHGVKINGETVRGSQALIPGDVIQVASAKLVFFRKLSGGGNASTATPPR
jgi:pSer/pThr/pTyr-binding forkhead associated (FHA) protein